MKQIMGVGAMMAALVVAGCSAPRGMVSTGPVDVVDYYCEGGHTFQLDVRGNHALLTVAGQRWRLEKETAAGDKTAAATEANQAPIEEKAPSPTRYRGCVPLNMPNPAP